MGLWGDGVQRERAEKRNRDETRSSYISCPLWYSFFFLVGDTFEVFIITSGESTK